MRLAPSHLATAGLLLAFQGCGKRVTDANLHEVRENMSTKEVESILGQPAKIESHELPLQTQPKTLAATTYEYHENGQTVILYFVGDKLIKDGGIQGRFGQ